MMMPCEPARNIRIFPLAIVVAAVAVFAISRTARAKDTDRGRARAAVVLLITAGDTAADRARERRFATELSLNTGKFQVEQVPAGVDGFLQMSLDRQIDHISAVIDQKGAAAAMWLNATSDYLLLQPWYFSCTNIIQKFYLWVVLQIFGKEESQ